MRETWQESGNTVDAGKRTMTGAQSGEGIRGGRHPGEDLLREAKDIGSRSLRQSGEMPKDEKEI